MTLLFDEEQHKYFFEEDPSIKLTSVSKIIEKYHEKFDIELRSLKYAEELNKPLAERLKYIAKKKMNIADAELFLSRFGATQEDVKKMWAVENKKSTDRGHKYHLSKEEQRRQESRKGKKVFEHEITASGLKKAFDITKLAPGIYPELILYHPKYGVVGTADDVEIYDDLTFDLSDHKTNKKLEFEGFPVWNKSTLQRDPKKMFAPIQHLQDCNGIHYTIQLSIYAFMLEEAGYTLSDKGLNVFHALFDEEGDPVDNITYKLNYLKKEVKSLLTHFKNTK